MSLSFVLIIISAILSKQDAPCWRIAPRLPKCRECWNALPIGQQRENERPKCRFYNFRRLVTTKSGQLAVAGFLDPFMSVFLFFFLNPSFCVLSFLFIDVFVVHFSCWLITIKSKGSRDSSERRIKCQVLENGEKSFFSNLALCFSNRDLAIIPTLVFPSVFI